MPRSRAHRWMVRSLDMAKQPGQIFCWRWLGHQLLEMWNTLENHISEVWLLYLQGDTLNKGGLPWTRAARCPEQGLFLQRNLACTWILRMEKSVSCGVFALFGTCCQPLVQLLFCTQAFLDSCLALSKGPTKRGKFLLEFLPCTRAAMMKPQKKRLGGGNKDPNTRMAFPDVDMDTFVDKLDGYVRQMGTKEAFNLYNYANMEPQQAESAKSLHKLHKLLEACVATSPEAKIKYKHLKGALQTLQQRFGQELLSAHFDMPDKTLLPGKVADCMDVLLKHWRRCTSSEANWSKVTKQLEDSQVAVLMRVYKQTSGKQGTARVLGPNVTVDSEGFPALLGSALRKGSSSDQEQGSEASSLSMDSSGFPKMDELDARATAQSPPPPLKKDWRKGAGLLKRPAAKTAVEPPKKKPACPEKGEVGAGLAHDTPINVESLSIGGGKNQSYIQHSADPAAPSRKVLVAAITTSQAAKTSKTHKDFIQLLLPACKKDGATKGSVVAARDILLAKFKKKHSWTRERVCQTTPWTREGCGLHPGLAKGMPDHCTKRKKCFHCCGVSVSSGTTKNLRGNAVMCSSFW